MHTIARNAAINFLKHKYVCDAYLNNNQETGYSSTSEEDLIAKELEMLIDELVGGMPEQRRMIYTLSRNEGLSNAEIAERLNTTKGYIHIAESTLVCIFNTPNGSIRRE